MTQWSYSTAADDVKQSDEEKTVADEKLCSNAV